MKLSARIRRNAGAAEFATGERCYITELWSIADEPGLTVAIARVEPGVSTQLHALEGVDERYVILEGTGRMEVGDLPAADVGPGDVVAIPAGTPQRITNTGEEDLRFYCLCSPGYTPACYWNLEG